MNHKPLYYESHITIEPVYGPELVKFEYLAKAQGYRVARLLLQKDRDSTPERSDKDSFCTGRDKDYDSLHYRMMSLVANLQETGFKVWRYKIESVIFDEKVKG